jgi:hypothetical protein
VLALYAVLDRTAAVSSVRSNPISEAYRFGARLLEYVMPPAGHWAWGSATRGWWDTHLHGSNLSEATLYLGWTMLALAAVAVVLALRRRLEPQTAGTVQVLVILALVAVLFSFPPTLDVAGVDVTTPSRFVYKVTSTWRAFGRFVIVVMLATALLGAIGLAALARSTQRRVAVALLAAAAVLVPADLWARIPGPAVYRIGHPRVYGLLAGEPPGILAEYPLVPAEQGPQDAELYRDQHGRRLLNRYVLGSPEEARALWLARLDDPHTAPRLALLGVGDVIVKPATPIPGVPLPGRPGRGFLRVAEAGGRTLYRVTAAPAASLVWPARGFSLPEGSAGAQFAWLTRSSGELGAIARCGSCRGTLEFTAWSLGQPRRLKLTLEGRTFFDRMVGIVPRVYRAPLELAGAGRIGVETSPGPQGAGPGDPRLVAVAFREPRFVPARPG